MWGLSHVCVSILFHRSMWKGTIELKGRGGGYQSKILWRKREGRVREILA